VTRRVVSFHSGWDAIAGDVIIGAGSNQSLQGFVATGFPPGSNLEQNTSIRCKTMFSHFSD
jgi:hypothetical protein